MRKNKKPDDPALPVATRGELLQWYWDAVVECRKDFPYRRVRKVDDLKIAPVFPHIK
jgi:hypothetical protein